MFDNFGTKVMHSKHSNRGTIAIDICAMFLTNDFACLLGEAKCPSDFCAWTTQTEQNTAIKKMGAREQKAEEM